MEELFSLLSLNIVIHSSNLFVIETMVVSCIPSVKGNRKHLLSRKQTIAIDLLNEMKSKFNTSGTKYIGSLCLLSIRVSPNDTMTISEIIVFIDLL